MSIKWKHKVNPIIVNSLSLMAFPFMSSTDDTPVLEEASVPADQTEAAALGTPPSVPADQTKEAALGTPLSVPADQTEEVAPPPSTVAAELAEVRAQVAAVVSLRGHSSSGCSSHFVDPVEWMGSLVLGSVEGKVCCASRLSYMQQEVLFGGKESFQFLAENHGL